ncbi:hypothetical protein ACT1U9_32550 [Streptomyces sp. BR1]|uniref:hypothetical protein n=1 Tax=Streptomyces sp. BR1 TaxID=1592323 RepID=UPI00402BC59A
MAYLVVQQRVTDPQLWSKEFHTADQARRAAGGGTVLLLADPGDPGLVTAVVSFDSAAQAHAWRARPGIAEQLGLSGVDLASIRVRVMEEIPDVQQ